MIDESPYRRLSALNDQPLSQAQEQEEEQKLRLEVEKRKSESARERARRVAKYQKERRQDHELMAEMTRAFDFRLAGNENVDGHDCWVLEATPKPGYQPKEREAKVLTGMRGKLWVDKEQYQWVKVEAEVMHPVSFYGVLARVGPGTRFLLEQAPLSGDLWLPVRFSVDVNATALGFINENSTDDETYRDYRPMKSAVDKSAALAIHPATRLQDQP